MEEKWNLCHWHVPILENRVPPPPHIKKKKKNFCDKNPKFF